MFKTLRKEKKNLAIRETPAIIRKWSTKSKVKCTPSCLQSLKHSLFFTFLRAAQWWEGGELGREWEAEFCEHFSPFKIQFSRSFWKQKAQRKGRHIVSPMSKNTVKYFPNNFLKNLPFFPWLKFKIKWKILNSGKFSPSWTFTLIPNFHQNKLSPYTRICTVYMCILHLDFLTEGCPAIPMELCILFKETVDKTAGQKCPLTSFSPAALTLNSISAAPRGTTPRQRRWVGMPQHGRNFPGSCTLRCQQK